MGIPTDAWVNKRKSIFIASPSEEQRTLNSQQQLEVNCILEGLKAGVKAASIACVVTAVPTLVAVRVFPWAKSNLNYTAQALIITAASFAAYMISGDKTISECMRRNSREAYEKSA
ncbi:hypothetical protein IFM89_027962 [Coptis chinensis]|uniref:Early nodulin-93-like n=1 Tax=Coptis chinensis TaxID=261450 RepID=A0A835IG96_9MAGN|nr:hypothetical protein IFM89_027962 [Coptis chinensis]